LVRGGLNGFEGRFNLVICNDKLEFELWKEVDNIFCAAVKLCMSFLAAKPFGFNNRHALKTDFLQSFLHFVQFERFDNRFYFLHGLLPER